MTPGDVGGRIMPIEATRASGNPEVDPASAATRLGPTGPFYPFAYPGAERATTARPDRTTPARSYSGQGIGADSGIRLLARQLALIGLTKCPATHVRNRRPFVTTVVVANHICARVTP